MPIEYEQDTYGVQYGDRAMRDFAKMEFKKRDTSLQKDMMLLFRNLRMAIVSSKRYEDLCIVVWFLNRICSLLKYRVISPNCPSILIQVAAATDLLTEGEELIWRHLGGVPKGADAFVPTSVRSRACSVKGDILESVDIDKDKVFGAEDTKRKPRQTMTPRKMTNSKTILGFQMYPMPTWVL